LRMGAQPGITQLYSLSMGDSPGFRCLFKLEPLNWLALARKLHSY
jgi:hypothetical protein